jgi:DUF1365 family protein
VKSALYEGWVRHRRFEPVRHEFLYRVFLTYLDLAELPHVFDGRLLWSAGRRNAAAFHRKDYLGDPHQPLDEAVRSLVHARTGTRPSGPIRLLTHLRYFGYCFNPVSFYYCFDAEDRRVEAVVAEVTNTPWAERHAYVVQRDRDGRSLLRACVPKQLHVSPFMEMNVGYDWRLTTPGERLAVHMINRADGRAVFDATMVLSRREIGGATLARALVRYPLMTAQVTAAIHWQALRLWWRGAPFHVHPSKRRNEAA